MDQTTLTAALKPLERRGWVAISRNPDDKRGRLLSLTEAGKAILSAAVPIWEKTHAEVEATLVSGGADSLRADLLALC